MELCPNLKNMLRPHPAKGPSRPAFQKSQFDDVIVKKPDERFKRHPDQHFLQEPASFLRIAEKPGLDGFLAVAARIKKLLPDPRLPSGILVVSVDPSPEVLIIIMDKRGF